ncbi:peptidase inhibitor family I36 protein [Actinoplanes sp. GCM10030250]
MAASATVLAVGVSGWVASPASAACSSPYFCAYQNEDRSGGEYKSNGDNDTYHDGDTFANGYRLYDAISSYRNMNGTYCFVMTTGHYFTGSEWEAYPNESVNYMIGYNDVASSHFKLGPSQC